MGKTTVLHPFEPISNEHSRFLVLGTLPSIISRKENFYYAHPRNRFWRVIAESFHQPYPETTEEKKRLILANGIALWDMIAACEIDGSSDSSIQKPMLNDIASLIHGKPIQKILCNGNTAYKLCLTLRLPVPVLYMPSTSPANAAWSMERLVATWKRELAAE